MKRKKPYPNLTRIIDRHGKVRWRFRKKGLPSTYVHGEYDSAEFRVNYEKALTSKTPIGKPGNPNSLGWLIGRYKESHNFRRNSAAYRRFLALEMERLRNEHGHRIITQLRPVHVRSLMEEKSAVPAAANNRLKVLRILCRFAVVMELIPHDPTAGIAKFRMNADGFHVWTDAEIAQFEAFHGIYSEAVLALRLMLYTGAARQDCAKMGWQNVEHEHIRYVRHKTGQEVDLPILRELRQVIEPTHGRLLFIVNKHGRGFTPESFGNWFGKKCREAGVPGTAHGLRKAGATRLANAGATEFEVMAYLGHANPNEASTYTKKANRTKLGDSGMAKLKTLSNQIERLDKYRY